MKRKDRIAYLKSLFRLLGTPKNVNMGEAQQGGWEFGQETTTKRAKYVRYTCVLYSGRIVRIVPQSSQALRIVGLKRM